MFYTSPEAKGQTVITDAQRVKDLIKKSKENFFEENTLNDDDTRSLLSGNQFNSNNPLNYDDDYYSDGEEESAELNANFVGKDYADDDEFYDYEEYDSIVNRRDEFLPQDATFKEKVQKSNEEYDYEYYDDDYETTSEKQLTVSPERQKSNQYANNPLNGSFKQRHSFSSVDRRNEDYDEPDYGWKEGDYNDDDDDLAQKEVYQYARATTEYPPRNYHITYDGRNKYSPEEEENEALPNYQPLLPSHEDIFSPISDDANVMQQGNLI